MPEVGAVVLSLAGRDSGKLLATVGSENGFILVCDGKERPVERPKRKNSRHLRCLNITLSEDDLRTNRALRKALARVRESIGENSGG